MSLVINHNLMAMNTERTLGATYSRLSTSIRRLSSRLRVVSAAEDAAGLAVREQMGATIQTIDQGIQKAQDGISAVMNAKSDLVIIDANLQRMKKLATQVATNTYTQAERMQIHAEFMQVAANIDKISIPVHFKHLKSLARNKSVAGQAAVTTNNGGWNDSNQQKSLTNSQAAEQNASQQTNCAIFCKDNTRTALGNICNYLNAKLDFLAVQLENLQAADSRISDMDIATELSELVCNQSLPQTRIIMFKKALEMPQTAQ